MTENPYNNNGQFGFFESESDYISGCHKGWNQGYTAGIKAAEETVTKRLAILHGQDMFKEGREVGEEIGIKKALEEVEKDYHEITMGIITADAWRYFKKKLLEGE